MQATSRLMTLSLLSLTACRIGFDATTGDGAGGDDGPPATSCMGLAATCGSTSCCDSPMVSGGTFFRGYDMAADGMYTDTTRPATVSTFRLDRYEVTVGRFRQFVSASMGTQQNPPPSGAGGRALNGMANQGGWDPAWDASLAADTAALVAALKCDTSYQTWTDTPAGTESRPINCITWYEAMAFCVWDGGFLPTEAESHYAASGGGLGRAYPWSSPAGDTTIDCAKTNFGGPNWPTTACVGAGANDVGATSPSGDGVWGQTDLGGNVWEWVLDWHDSAYPSPCNDCAMLVAAAGRVYRGGGFDDNASSVRAASRRGVFPTYRDLAIGVRCARTP